MIPELPKNDKCTGCGACLCACEYAALSFIEDEQGFQNPCIDSDKCIQCGRCEQICPIVHRPEGHKLVEQCFALWANTEIRKTSSSGGMFYLLAQEILSRGGVVFGATLDDDLRVRHIAVTSLDKLHLIQGSKYVQSELGDVYSQVRQLQSDGKVVLFSGCPCHIAGLRSFLGKDYDTLYTVDVICHGISANRALTKFLDESIGKQNVKTVQFRNKANGWAPNILTVVLRDGTIQHVPFEECSFEQAFHKNEGLRPSCYDCPFCGLSRQGDVTMGDFWGIETYSTDWNDQKGTSVVLVNSDKGQHLFEKVKITAMRVEEIPLENAIKRNRIREKLIRPGPTVIG